MADHSELVSEIGVIEKMTTTERLKHAKKRRQMQLKKFGQYEKQLDKEQGKKSKKSKDNKKTAKKTNNNARRIIFVDSIMLLEAAARNDIEEVRSLLQKEVSPDVTNEDGLTALHQCCIDDQADMMKLLISYGANVNARDSELWTPLHAAATCGHVHLCSYLIESGAELLAVNADGNMPYDICEDEETLDFIENEMAKRGVTQELIDNTRLSTERQMLDDLRNDPTRKLLEVQGRQGETPLHIAAANGYLEVAEYLLEQRVRVDVPDNDSWQPIHAAACWGHLPLLEVLVQYGADLDARTKNGETPYDICEDPEIRDRILEMRTEIESNKRTRSHRLVRRRSTNTRSSGNFHNSTGSLYSSNQSLQGDRNLSTVRRSSVRGKGAMYLKEAKEEAERLREAVSSNDDEEEEDTAAAQQQSVSLVNDINDISVTINGSSEASKPDPDSSLSPPSHTHSYLSSTDTDSISPPSATIMDSSSLAPSPQKQQPQQPQQQSTPPSKPTSPKPIAPPPPSTQHQKPSPSPVLRPKSENSSSIPRPPDRNSQQAEQISISPPAPTPAPIEPSKHRAPNPPDVVQAKTTKPTAPTKPVDAPPPKQSAPSGSSSNRPDEPPRSESSINNQAPDREPYIQRPQVTTSTAQGPLDPFMVPPSGTLADLKKKRAQELRDSMRFRDSSRLSQQIEKHNENYETNGHHNNASSASATVPLTGAGANAGDPTLSSSSSSVNGQNGAGQNGAVRRDSDVSYYGLDAPKHKFTASTQEIVGGQDNQTGCCVLM